MSEPIWDKFLTERDKAVFAAGGFGARAGFGKRPALLVIDVNWAFCGEQPVPILEVYKTLADFVRRGGLGGARLHQEADRRSAGQGATGDLYHRRAQSRQLGCRQLALEEFARR